MIATHDERAVQRQIDQLLDESAIRHEHLDFAIVEFREMKIQASLQ